MTSEAEPAITRVLEAVDRGDPAAGDALLPLVYESLRRLARAKMADAAPDVTLQPTALVHEAYLRVVGERDPGWKSRGHFFGAAAQAMRRIMVEQARRKARRARVAPRKPVDVDDLDIAIAPPDDDLVRVDEALARLESADPFNRQIVNLRYFVGLSTQDTATALGVSVWAVERQWRFIRTWLERALSESSRE